MKINFIFFTILVLIIMPMVLSPVMALAQEAGLVPCGQAANDGQGGIANPCKFQHVLVLINKVVRFVLFKLVVPIAAIAFAWAGFLLLFSGGNSSQKEKAKKIFWSVLLGLAVAVAAWLIVYTVLNILGYQGVATDFGF